MQRLSWASARTSRAEILSHGEIQRRILLKTRKKGIQEMCNSLTGSKPNVPFAL